jgi:nicotinamide-nucleotide amidase
MSIYPQALTELAAAVLSGARKKNLRIATAESCTGGLIMGCLTEIAGSSDVLDRGFITYSYDSKTALLGVDRALLEKSGAVSSAVALQMAAGALKAASADIVVAATGIAGPGGATENKPVGLVYLGVANGRTGQTYALKNIFGGDRSAVRLETVETALDILMKEIAAA